MIDEAKNSLDIANEISQLVARSKKSVYVIIDGDRTLIPTDSTKFFFQYLNLEFTDLKNIFQKHGYSFESFHEVALYYSKIEESKYNDACIFSAGAVTIYPEFITFINSVKDIAELVLITSGVKRIWQNIIYNHSIDFMHLFGGNYFPQDSFLVDKNAKGTIANTLKKLGKIVFAFGDTLIDFDMLKEANYSYLVVNEKMNIDIIPYISEIKHLQQISFTNNRHSNLPETNLNKIRELIESCCQP